jgi:putative hemolysin
MKKNVIDQEDLEAMSPIFKNPVGRFIGKVLLKALKVDKVNAVHSNNCQYTGAAFTSAILKDPLIDVKYKIHNEEILDTLPEGAFITVSNHPIGSIDGIILIDIFASRRPDFKVMVNGLLGKISAMAENFIQVKPDSKKEGANMKNINGVRLSFQMLKEGHPMGFFPAGAISMYNKESKKIQDLPWTHAVVRLIKKAGVPIYPVYFDALNSSFFYWLARIDWRIRTIRIPAEAFNKHGKTIDVYIGKPITPEEISGIKDEKELADYLYAKTYESKETKHS